MNQTMYEGYS